MKLTPRLHAIATKVPAGSVVVDIGTDHAYIPVYLLKNHIAASVIASDNRVGPLDAAAETVNLFNVEKMVDLRLGNGLDVLRGGDQVDVIIIAGMGGETIRAILTRGLSVITPKIHLVLQPMTETGLVRCWLSERGFSIINEDIAQEGENFYEIIVAQLNDTVNKNEYLEIGPRLIEDRHPLLKPMLEQRLNRMRLAAVNAAKSDSTQAQERFTQLEIEIARIEEVLSCL